MTAEPLLLTIAESPRHPDFSRLYQRLGIRQIGVNSVRKALSKLKTIQPDYIVAEFFYGYGNNYAGVHISNLDVVLSTLQKYSPGSRVIVMVDKSERQFVDKLNELLPLHAVLQHPVQESQMEDVLSA